jgi:hypothetical protein
VHYHAGNPIAGLPPVVHSDLGYLGGWMTIRAKRARAPARPRAPLGKKQLLVIMDREVIKRAKLAAVEDEKKVSHVVEEAVQEWLSRRASHRAI